jgi:hypothetical protein
MTAITLSRFLLRAMVACGQGPHDRESIVKTGPSNPMPIEGKSFANSTPRRAAESRIHAKSGLNVDRYSH